MLSKVADSRKLKVVIMIDRNQENRVPDDLDDNEKNCCKMPVFKCSCGVEILIIPDLPAMVKAIKNHLVEHKKLTGHRLSEEILTQEILRVIIDIYN